MPLELGHVNIFFLFTYMSKVIFIDDNGRHHDITQAVREQMGELNHHSSPQFRQQENHRQMMHQAQPQRMQGGMPMPRHMQGMPTPQRMQGGMPMPHHMQGIENAMPLPQGMRPEDFAGNDNVRVIPVAVPMNGMQMPNHMPQGRSVYGMRMGQPVSMNRGQAQPQRGVMFRQPIPSHQAMGGSPFYQTFDDEF